MAKGGRRYARDNRGRFASVGATARGGRLKTAGGNKRQKVTAKAKGGGSGTIAKPKGLKPGTLKPKPKIAAQAKARQGKRPKVTDEKAARIASRVNSVTMGAASRGGVKSLNATEVGVRAKAFLTRKVGGVTGVKDFQHQQEVIKSALSKPTRYSTQKPNRNKPEAYNNLGQASRRAKAAEAAKAPKQKIQEANQAKAQSQRKKQSTRVSRRRLDLYGDGPGLIKSKRVTNTIRKPKAKPSSVVARTRSQAKAAQRNRRNQILDKTRPIVGRNPGLKRVDTGMRQLSLTGPAKPLYSYRRTKIRRR